MSLLIFRMSVYSAPFILRRLLVCQCRNFVLLMCSSSTEFQTDL
jgi:hypothetical protein